MGINRRNILLGSTATVAASLSGPTEAKTKSQSKKLHWDKETDILVIGSGATGVPAALKAEKRATLS